MRAQQPPAPQPDPNPVPSPPIEIPPRPDPRPPEGPPMPTPLWREVRSVLSHDACAETSDHMAWNSADAPLLSSSPPLAGGRRSVCNGSDALRGTRFSVLAIKRQQGRRLAIDQGAHQKRLGRPNLTCRATAQSGGSARRAADSRTLLASGPGIGLRLWRLAVAVRV
jgi:hypothetical protein